MTLQALQISKEYLDVNDLLQENATDITSMYTILTGLQCICAALRALEVSAAEIKNDNTTRAKNATKLATALFYEETAQNTGFSRPICGRLFGLDTNWKARSAFDYAAKNPKAMQRVRDRYKQITLITYDNQIPF